MSVYENVYTYLKMNNAYNFKCQTRICCNCVFYMQLLCAYNDIFLQPYIMFMQCGHLECQN